MLGSEDTCCPLSLWCLQCRLQELPVQCQVVKILAVHCDSDVFSAAGGHSAGCTTSWVCLQHHATVVTCNGVTICGSKFPPTVSKHCQHQHSAIPKTIPAICNTNNPSCCDIQGAASSVQHHGSLCSQPQKSIVWCPSRPANIQQSYCHTVSPGLPTYSNHTVTQCLQACQHTAIILSHSVSRPANIQQSYCHTVYSFIQHSHLLLTSSEILPKISNYQHWAIHFYILIHRRQVVIT